MSQTNWLNADAISGTTNAGLPSTATAVAANATIGACAQAIATTLLANRGAWNSPMIEEALDHLQRMLRSITKRTYGNI